MQSTLSPSGLSMLPNLGLGGRERIRDAPESPEPRAVSAEPRARAAFPSEADLCVSSPLRARAFWLVAAAYTGLILGAPLGLAAAVVGQLASRVPTGIAAALAAPAAALLCALVPGLLSLPHQRWIVAAKMPTDVGIRAYFHRRLYGLCWTSLYYNQLVYWLVLSFPPLRRLVFALFGYRGTHRFTVYPDTWIRDLPLLRIGERAYLSNKATIGTNMILSNRQIVVDEIEIGPGATVGHLACVGPGTRCERGSEIGVGALVGIRARIGEQAQIGPGALVDHGARIGARCNVQNGAVVGSATVLGPEVYVAAGTVVKSRARVRSQAELAANTERD